MTRYICDCLRCGWKWMSKLNRRPKRCPNCQAIDWWRLPDRKFSGINGRPRKYHIDILRQNQTITLEVTEDKLVSARQCVQHLARKTGRTFEIKPCIDGLKIKRLT